MSNKLEQQFSEVLENYKTSVRQRWEQRNEGSNAIQIARMTVDEARQVFAPITELNVMIRSREEYYGHMSVAEEIRNEVHDIIIGSKLFINTVEDAMEMNSIWRATPDWLRNKIAFLEENRLKAIVEIAKIRAMRDSVMRFNGATSSISGFGFEISQENTIYRSASDANVEDFINENRFTLTLKGLANHSDGSMDVMRCRELYEDIRNSWKSYIKDGDGKPSGLKNYLVPFEKNSSDLEGFDELAKRIPENGLAARTWGFEIEVPDAKGVEPENQTIEKGEDGSIRSYENDDCDCDCRSCSYHECNCDNCEDYNDSPDHDCGYSECQSADMAEFRSIGGIQKVRHAVMAKLLEDLNEVDAEMNDTAGTHIHVYARDLTTNQVGQVIAIYKLYENLFGNICGRKNVQYAGDVQYDHISMALRNKKPMLKAHKALAVNVMHLADRGRGTIEFRGMDCNLNNDRIITWAWLVRGLVTVAQRGATWNMFKDKGSLKGLLEVFAKFNVTPENEHPGIAIPGSKSDKGMYVERQLQFV